MQSGSAVSAMSSWGQQKASYQSLSLLDNLCSVCNPALQFKHLWTTTQLPKDDEGSKTSAKNTLPIFIPLIIFELYVMLPYKCCICEQDDPPLVEDDEDKEKRTDDISPWDANFLKVIHSLITDH